MAEVGIDPCLRTSCIQPVVIRRCATFSEGKAEFDRGSTLLVACRKDLSRMMVGDFFLVLAYLYGELVGECVDGRVHVGSDGIGMEILPETWMVASALCTSFSTPRTIDNS